MKYKHEHYCCYILHKHRHKYYVVPFQSFDGYLCNPENFMSFYLKSNAEKCKESLNKAIEEGKMCQKITNYYDSLKDLQ